MGSVPNKAFFLEATMRSFLPRRLTAVLAVAASLTGCGPGTPPKQAAAPPPEAGVIVLEARDVPLETELPGRTSPYEISEVRPQVSGIIQARLFEEGAEVKAGQVLYRIDPSPYQAAVNQARAQLANTEASVQAARLKSERYAGLLKIGAVSRQDAEEAEAAYRQVQAQIQQNRAALQAAEINLAYTEVKAPISGRIGRSNFTKGALVTASQTQPLTTIQRLDPIYVDMTQSSAELLALKREIAMGEVQKGGTLSARVRLTLEDGAIYPKMGELKFTDVTVDPTSGAVTLRAVFPNPEGVLLPGMYVRAIVTEGIAKNAILAPQQGIERDPKGNASAMVVDAENKAQQRPVEIARAVGEAWLVTKGLRGGDRLIVQGLQRIRPGMTVSPVPAGVPPQWGPAVALESQPPTGPSRQPTPSTAPAPN